MVLFLSRVIGGELASPRVQLCVSKVFFRSVKVKAACPPNWVSGSVAVLRKAVPGFAGHGRIT